MAEGVVHTIRGHGHWRDSSEGDQAPLPAFFREDSRQIAVGLSESECQVSLEALAHVAGRPSDEPRSQSGQTMVDYALILGGIAIVCIVAIVFFGGSIRDLFARTGSSTQARSAPFRPPYPSTVSFPTALVDCEDGGWRNYAQFSSEAACKDYVGDVTP